MPEDDPIGHGTTANGEGDTDYIIWPVDVPTVGLDNSANNIIAVEVHKASANDNTFAFDMGLTAVPAEGGGSVYPIDSRYACFINQQYKDFLERDGELAGMNYYLKLVTNGALSYSTMVRNFIASPEFATKNGFIARCYFGLLNNNMVMDYNHPNYRIPDYNGMVVLKDIMDAQPSIVEAKQLMVQMFLDSDEFGALAGTNLDDATFVRKIHEHILGRAANQGEVDYYVSQFNNGFMTRSDLAFSFLEHPSTVEKYSNSTYVVMCYLGLLDRGAERAGFQYYMNLLSSGAIDVVSILNGFIYSPEYQNRLDQLGCTFISQF